MLTKHLAFIRQGIQISLQYRSEQLLWIVIDFVPFIALAFVWKSIFATGGDKAGYTLAMVLQHYLLVVLIQRLSECHFDSFRSAEIREGKIDFFLIRPYSFVQQILTADISGKILTTIWFLPALALFGAFLYHLDPQVISFVFMGGQLLSFLSLVFAAYVIHFLISLIIVFLTFWFEGSSGLEHFKWASIALLSGGIMPYELMPAWLQTIINLLPFKYLYSIPIRVLQGQYQTNPGDWIIVSSTIIFLSGIATFLWNKGRMKYASAGG
jgi:ABC-2 type transport system permease protein